MDSESKPRLLIVDDDPVFGRVMKAVAEAGGWTVTFYSSVSKAYEHAGDGPWDAAIIDYDLGRVTGVQFGNYLDRMGGRIPILLVSALRVPADFKWPTPVSGFLSKKTKPEDILAEIVRLHVERKAA